MTLRSTVLNQRLSTSVKNSPQCLQKLLISPMTILLQSGQCVGSIRLRYKNALYKIAGASGHRDTKNKGPAGPCEPAGLSIRE